MARKYQYIKLSDRQRIGKMYHAGYTLRKIAEYIGVHPGSIHREIKRGYTGRLDANGRREYDPVLAQKNVLGRFY